ncbi:hypothetical protein CDAR_307331 [Caerostris darwini]|uniref:Uncharacterized protein n=1 Tax=Caerostris darwini TaxID=1538125 RepID=A0AAV4T4I5_9ARAC|nr:hypothetical protein CDAR_307331 [Caerostris darwini]
MASRRGNKCKVAVHFVMYSDEPGSSSNQNKAKSCIQALLRNREQNLNKSPSNNLNQDPSYSDRNLGAPSNLSDLEGTEELEEPSDDFKYTETNLPENLDNQNDFNYSQKLFHIADGNLYSIFSPIQGRSYGMKPSFLRKQKYTVQECHSRGRKKPPQGLKEEHGTKQITISNWSQSVQNSSSEPVNISKQSAMKSDLATTRSRMDHASRQSHVSKFAKNHPAVHNVIPNGNVDPYDFNLSLQSSNSFESHVNFSKNSNASSTVSRLRDSAKSVASKKDSLNFVLNSLLDRPESSENRNSNCDQAENSSTSSFQNLKHRRKPLQTRRVVPYVKYLSIMEESEGIPLDLSAKCSEKPVEEEESKLITEESIENNFNSLKNGSTFIQNHNDIVSGSNSNYSIKNNSYQNTSTLGSLLQSQMPASLMFLSPSINTVSSRQPFTISAGKVPQEMENVNGKLSMALNSKQIRIKNSYPPLDMNAAHSSTDNMPFSVHKSLIKESQSRSRRRNQRSVIKQKLEDTFKQNGFLVKTKQVSDGEATFCKFRQLRKYTRYYLKSWQHHLPDEVNKMWKGFLPPKTVLPPATNNIEHNLGTP